MKTIAINADNDIYLERGNIAIATDVEAVKHTAENYAKVLKGEMIHSTKKGIPFFDVTFGKGIKPSQFDACLRRRLLEIKEVERIVSLYVSREGETWKYTAYLRTIYGDIPLNGTL